MQCAIVAKGNLETFLRVLEKQIVVADDLESAKELAERWKALKSGMLGVVVSVTLNGESRFLI